MAAASGGSGAAAADSSLFGKMRGVPFESGQRAGPDPCGQPAIPWRRHLAKHSRESGALDREAAVDQTRQSHAGSATLAGGDRRADRLPRESAVIRRVDHKSVGILYIF